MAHILLKPGFENFEHYFASMWDECNCAVELTIKKDVLFIIGDWNAKVGSQEIPWVTGKFGLEVQNEVGQRLRVLWREHSGHSKHPLPTTQEKTLHMDITRWSIPKPNWLYFLQPKMEKLYTVSKSKTGSWLWLRSWTPIAKFRLKLNKVGKTTRSPICFLWRNVCLGLLPIFWLDCLFFWHWAVWATCMFWRLTLCQLLLAIIFSHLRTVFSSCL